MLSISMFNFYQVFMVFHYIFVIWRPFYFRNNSSRDFLWHFLSFLLKTLLECSGFSSITIPGSPSKGSSQIFREVISGIPGVPPKIFSSRSSGIPRISTAVLSGIFTRLMFFPEVPIQISFSVILTGIYTDMFSVVPLWFWGPSRSLFQFST